MNAEEEFKHYYGGITRRCRHLGKTFLLMCPDQRGFRAFFFPPPSHVVHGLRYLY